MENIIYDNGIKNSLLKLHLHATTKYKFNKAFPLKYMFTHKHIEDFDFKEKYF